MEYWNSQLTEKSWQLLQELRKKYNFILIGGWAVYLWTKQQKSKDIDIIVDLNELRKLKSENLTKNDRLKKYEIKFGDVDVDIYVPYFSKLELPIEKLKNYSSKIEGFNVLSREALLILKQGAELERRNSVKGEKDKIDIVSLLFFSEPDLKKYKLILKENSKEFLINELINLLRIFNNYNSLNLAPNEFKKIKKKFLEELRGI